MLVLPVKEMGGDGGEPPASFKECEAPMAETSISKQESEMRKKYI